MIEWFAKNEKKLARIATVVIFLALIRTIGEVLRLQYYAATPLTFLQIKPFVIGALVAAVALLAMTLLSFWLKHKVIITISILTIILMLIIKGVYL
jgi:hypothetical protein